MDSCWDSHFHGDRLSHQETLFMSQKNTISSPRRPGNFLTLRWIDVFLRLIHICAVILLGTILISGSGGGFSLQIVAFAILLTGIGMTYVAYARNKNLLLEWTGLSLVVKLLLVIWITLGSTGHLTLFWILVAWSVIFSHAPKSFRHRQWRKP